MSEWISINDSLPPDDEDVLICSPYGTIEIGYQDSVTFEWLTMGPEGSYIVTKVAHWQPLPEPPEHP